MQQITAIELPDGRVVDESQADFRLSHALTFQDSTRRLPHLGTVDGKCLLWTAYGNSKHAGPNLRHHLHYGCEKWSATRWRAPTAVDSSRREGLGFTNALLRPPSFLA